MNVSGSHLSKEFFELVKAIGESRSKQEEYKIILAEILTLKQRLNEPNVPALKMKEYLVRSIYVEMLGHNASFAYIHAVKLTHDKNLLCKRIGYLVCSLCLDTNHELLLLLINTIQKDLGSSNHLEVAAALSCVCKLLSEEMVPAVFPPVLNLLLSHSNELVRKKCCLALHAIFHVQPELVIAETKTAIRRALCDPDPSVTAASLHLLHVLARQDREGYIDLVPSIVSILKQVIEHRLPRDYDYHRIPAPWIQVKLLSLLATLGEGDKEASENMQEVLVDVIHRAELGANAGFAIIYEAVKAVTTIYPSSRLLDVAANSISRFISAENHNLKYVGITGLASIVRVHPSFAARPDHQLIVLDSLEDADETLKRRTLELLFRMTNPMNVAAIVDKLLQHLRLSVDVDFRRDLVAKICRLADRFAPDHLWYLRTLNDVLEMGGALVPADTAHNLLRLVAEGPTANDEEDQAFRREAVNTYIYLAERASTLPDILVKVSAWVLAEYGSLTTVKGYENLEEILALLCDCLDKNYSENSTKAWILSALIKLSVLRFLALTSASSSSKMNPPVNILSDEFPSTSVWMPRELRLIPRVVDAIERFSASRSTDIEQRCSEFYELIIAPEPGSPFTTETLLREIYPFDGACEDIAVDEELSFLDPFVNKALQSGASPYVPESQRMSTANGTLSAAAIIHDGTMATQDCRHPQSSTFSGSVPTPSSILNFTPYGLPSTARVSTATTFSPALIDTSSPITDKEMGSIEGSSQSDVVFRVQGPRKWGPHGYQGFSAVTSAIQNTTFSKETFQTSHDSYKDSTSISSTSDAAVLPKLKNGNSITFTTQRALTDREMAARALFSGLTSGGSVSKSVTKTEMSPRRSLNAERATGMASSITATQLAQRQRDSAGAGSARSTDLLDLQWTATTSENSVSAANLEVTKSAGNLVDPRSPRHLLQTTASRHASGLNLRLHFNESTSETSTVDHPDKILDSPFSATQPESQNFFPRQFLMEPSAAVDLRQLDKPHLASGGQTHILKPLHVTTVDVGTIWPQLTAEQRGSLRLRAPMDSVNTLFYELETILNAAVVEVIGFEGILAGQLVKSANFPEEQSAVFVHAKFSPPDVVDVIFRGTDQQCLETLFYHCKECLSSKATIGSLAVQT